jgi:tetratricopeptide (TPR) repeat protein
MRRWANQEAVSHLRRGLEQLQLANPSDDLKRVELEINAALGTALIATEGYTSVHVRNAYERAREICLELDDAARLATVTVGLFAYHIVRLDLEDAAALADSLTTLAADTGSEQISLLADAAQGSVHLNLGNLQRAQRHFEAAIATYDPERHASLHLSFGHDLGVICYAYLGAVHWFAGYPVRSRETGEAAVALARRVRHPHSLALALAFLGAQHLWRRDTEAVVAVAEELLSLATERRFRHWQADALLMQACVLAEHGKSDAALERLEHAASLFRHRGSGADPQYDLRMARVFDRVGRKEDALRILDSVTGNSGVVRAFRWQSEFGHLMAQVLTSIEGRRGEAESWLRRSLEDARRQDARSAELRIATSLAGLLVETGRHEEAEAMLRPILDTFTEGHELPDLRDAAELLGRVETVRSQAASARPRS